MWGRPVLLLQGLQGVREEVWAKLLLPPEMSVGEW